MSASGARLARAYARVAAVRPAAPAIITCAVSGGLVTGNPHQPMTLDEVVGAAIEAADAGASAVHIHARSRDGGFSADGGDYAAIAAAIRASGRDVLVNVTPTVRVWRTLRCRRRSLPDPTLRRSSAAASTSAAAMYSGGPPLPCSGSQRSCACGALLPNSSALTLAWSRAQQRWLPAAASRRGWST